MIVDTHTLFWHSVDQLGPQISAALRHRFADEPDTLDASAHAHAEATTMVDVAFVLGLRSVRLGTNIPLERLAEHVKAQPDRRIGFAGIDPTEADAPAHLDRARALGLSGVVISPSDQGFHPCDSRAMLLYDRCQTLSLPIFVHQAEFAVRDSMLEFAGPALFDEVARSFPKLKLLFGRVGMPYPEQTLALVAKHTNVFAELSGLAARPWALYNVLLEAHESGAIDRLLFGSGFPFQRPDRTAENIYQIVRFTQGAALPPVPRERLRGIIERDALSLLDLKRAAGPATTASQEMESSTETAEETVE